MTQLAPEPSIFNRARADGVRFELANAADDAQIRRLLRENPMPGRISISLEREPNATLAAALEGDPHHTVVARDPDTGRLMGLGSVAAREMYLNGEQMRVGYLGQLRLDHRYRGRASILLGGYRLFRELHDALGVKLYLTSVAADNVRAKRFLERGLRDMPTYRPLERFVTSVIEPRTLRTPAQRNVIRAQREHLADILACLERNGRRFQFAPAWQTIALPGLAIEDFVIAVRGGGVVGCAALWDQSAFKQAVVRAYAPALARWRPFINLASRFLNVPCLPRIGQAMDFAYVSHLAVDDDDADVFSSLLATIASRGRRLVLGLSARHSLSNAFPRAMKRRTYETDLYAVHWLDGRAAAESLDGRPCHPEVALL